jgi:DNA-directed RNA polymerase specialized sigma24 family protein
MDGRRMRFELASEISRLPTAEALVMLTYIREGSCRDASDALGIPLNTVKTKLHRMRNRWLRDS